MAHDTPKKPWKKPQKGTTQYTYLTHAQRQLPAHPVNRDGSDYVTPASHRFKTANQISMWAKEKGEKLIKERARQERSSKPPATGKSPSAGGPKGSGKPVKATTKTSTKSSNTNKGTFAGGSSTAKQNKKVDSKVKPTPPKATPPKATPPKATPPKATPAIGAKKKIAGKDHVYRTNASGVKGWYLPSKPATSAPKAPPKDKPKAPPKDVPKAKPGTPKIGDRKTIAGKGHIYRTVNGKTGWYLPKWADGRSAQNEARAKASTKLQKQVETANARIAREKEAGTYLGRG